MYTTSIIWYLAWPVLITVATIVIVLAVKKFDKEYIKPNES